MHPALHSGEGAVRKEDLSKIHVFLPRRSELEGHMAREWRCRVQRLAAWLRSPPPPQPYLGRHTARVALQDVRGQQVGVEGGAGMKALPRSGVGTPPYFLGTSAGTCLWKADPLPDLKEQEAVSQCWRFA